MLGSAAAVLRADPPSGPHDVPRSRRTVIELGSAIVIAVAGTVAIVYTAYALRDKYVGDAAVYLPYARNAAHGHFFQFNVGEFSSGSTSALWPLFLAVPHLFGPSLGGVKAFAALFTVAAFLATMLAARYVSRSWAAASVASLFVLGTMTIYGISMYESPLVLILGAAALVVGQRTLDTWMRRGRIDRRTLAPLVTVWAAMPLARPDAVILVAAQLVALFVCAPGARRSAAAVLLGAAAVATIPSLLYFGYSAVELGTPSTSSQERAFAIREVAAPLIGPFKRSAAAAHELTSSPWVFATPLCLAGLAGMLRSLHARWIGVHGGLALAAYVALLTFVTPAFYETPRYLLPVVPIVVTGVACLIVRSRGSTLWWPAIAVAALVLGCSAASELRSQVDLQRSFAITRDEVFERDVVARIDQLASPGDSVLSYEVQLRYYLRRDLRVLSEDGITDGKVAPYQSRHDLTGFVDRYQPRWWIADQNVTTRRYMRGSVLERAFLDFKRSPRRPSRTIDGIRFALVAQRARPLARGFGGWQMLFRLSYPSSPSN